MFVTPAYFGQYIDCVDCTNSCILQRDFREVHKVATRVATACSILLVAVQGHTKFDTCTLAQ